MLRSSEKGIITNVNVLYLTRPVRVGLELLTSMSRERSSSTEPPRLLETGHNACKFCHKNSILMRYVSSVLKHHTSNQIIQQEKKQNKVFFHHSELHADVPFDLGVTMSEGTRL
jgi:hypothetical protein